MSCFDTAGEKPEMLYPFLNLRKSVREAPSDSYRWCYLPVSFVVAGYIPVRQLVWRWQLYLSVDPYSFFGDLIQSPQPKYQHLLPFPI